MPFFDKPLRTLAVLGIMWSPVAALPAFGQSMVGLKNLPPGGGVGISFLLTDGRVIGQGSSENTWYVLTPDKNGQYVTGTWSQAASLPQGYVPLYFASAVLADGRLLIIGGEYLNNSFAFSNQGAIYDPVANTWTKLSPPKGFDFIGDSPAAVLPNGNFLLGQKFSHKDAVYNPTTNTWTNLADAGKKDFNAEEGWTLLPSGAIFTTDVKAAPNAETYDPVAQKWTSLGNTPSMLAGPPYVKIVHYGKNKIYHPPGEIGPAILRPDGTVFATGDLAKNASAGHTAIYTPGANGGKGTWKAGPDFAAGDSAGDSFAALLPSGNVLVEGNSGLFYEFNGSSLTRSSFNGQGNSLLLLPTGEVLIGGAALYRAAGSAQAAWAPVITNAPSTIAAGSSYSISGQQFNGLSQANAYGDENQTATNYPLVRITNTASGQVTYARTHNHSSMGVATGTAIITTTFDVPQATPAGASTLTVVANGIAATPVAVTVQ